MLDQDNRNNIIIPCINDQNECIASDGRIIYYCTMSDDGNISGYTSEGTKALYKADQHKWLFGKEIGFTNLINLADRTEDERKEIYNKSQESRKRNKEEKKTFNELAKAMLELTASDKVIRETLEDPEVMIDNTYGSLILAAMIQGARNGSFKCAEFVRDTAGYRPANKNEIDLTADIMTDADRSLIDKAYKTG